MTNACMANNKGSDTRSAWHAWHACRWGGGNDTRRGAGAHGRNLRGEAGGTAGCCDLALQPSCTAAMRRCWHALTPGRPPGPHVNANGATITRSNARHQGTWPRGGRLFEFQCQLPAIHAGLDARLGAAACTCTASACRVMTAATQLTGLLPLAALPAATMVIFPHASTCATHGLGSIRACRNTGAVSQPNWP